MKVRTKSEIAAEIVRLKNIAPVGTFAEVMSPRIKLVIAVLEGRKPETNSPTEREIVAEAWRWREGIDDVLPSQGWQAFTRP